MTTDERLEALAQSLEVWQHMQMDASKEYAERFRSLDKLFRANEERLAQLMDTMNRLGRILEIHDQQIDEHGDRLDDLERH
jgi:predicted house-cleaning noncanonical NTP pyrophosphatase (MazG superfamily)